MAKYRIPPRQAYGFNQPYPPLSPVPINADKDPTAADIGHEIGTVWINRLTNDIWMITSVAAGAANWESIGMDTAGAAPISRYVVDADGTGDYTTIQAAINAANTAGGNAAVYIRPGTYTENLTTISTIDLIGATAASRHGDVTIVGTHFLPLAGTISFRNIRFQTTANIFSTVGAAATAVSASFEGCRFNITVGGRTVQIPGSNASTITFLDCTDQSTDNGIYNNSGTGTLNIFGSQIGVQVTLALTVGGNTRIDGSIIGCSISPTAGTHYWTRSEFLDAVILNGTPTTYMDSCYLRRTGAQVLACDSTNPTYLTNSTIDCNNNPAIGGTGVGVLDIGNVNFIQNSQIAATVAQTYSRMTNRITPYIVGPTGNFVTVQAALDAAALTGIGEIIFIQPGTYTENLTLYDGMTLIGANIQSIITGVHTPPASGAVIFTDLYLTSATDIITSAAAGTTRLRFETCTFNCTNGYVVDCASWTGPVDIFNCNTASTADGVVNVGASTIAIEDSFVGAGTNALGIAGGTLAIINSRVACPISPTGACAASITQGSFIGGTVTTAGTTALAIYDSTISSGATQALTQGSAGALTVSNSTISTSFNPAIGGAGGGTVTLSDINFLSNANIVGTLALGFVPETKSSKFSCGDNVYPISTYTANSNIIQSYGVDITASGASTINAIGGNLSVNAGDGNHTPDGVEGSITTAAGGNVLGMYGIHGIGTQVDGSIIASTLVGTEGEITIHETDAADLPQVYAFGTKGYYRTDDAAAVPLTGEYAGIGSVVEYTTPLNAYGYGVVVTRLGAGAGTAGRAAFGVAQGTNAIADWLYGLDLYNTATNTGQAYTTADIRMQNQSTIAVATEGVTFSGDIDARTLAQTNTTLTFEANPVLQSQANTGAAPSGATGAVNIMACQEGHIMEEFIIGAGQTIIAPRMDNTGLLISLDLTATEGAEYNFGTFTTAKHHFVAGTSAAFYVEARFTVADVSGCDPLFLGFRITNANNANYLYPDIAGLGIITSQNAGTITLATQTGGGGVTYTNTTDAWTDGQTHTIRVNVDAAGAVTYLIDGVAPTVTAGYSFGAISVMPYISFLHAAVAPGNIHLISLSCGFQAWN